MFGYARPRFTLIFFLFHPSIGAYIRLSEFYVMINEIAFTGTPVTDIKRAREFYEDVLGLKPTMESAGGMWVEYGLGNSGTFAIGCYGDIWKPSKDGTCVAFEVDDLDAEISRLKSKGVKFAMEAMDSPICRFAIFSDPDGNQVMIHKRKSGN
jgi:predicted enzyme related to lactoylglutathione lyase